MKIAEIKKIAAETNQAVFTTASSRWVRGSHVLVNDVQTRRGRQVVVAQSLTQAYDDEDNAIPGEFEVSDYVQTFEPAQIASYAGPLDSVLDSLRTAELARLASRSTADANVAAVRAALEPFGNVSVDTYQTTAVRVILWGSDTVDKFLAALAAT